MQDPKLKSAFAPMRPQIDTSLADRLIRQAEARKAEATNTRSVCAPVVKPAPVKKVPAPPVAAPVPTAPCTVSLELELVDDPEKSSPVWGYIRPGVVGVVLNRAFEPTTSAMASRDLPVLKWLVMLGLVTRMICQHRREPRMKDIIKHLWRMVERPTDTFWDSPGVAYRLACHPLSAGLGSVDWEASGPQQFGSFLVLE